MQGFLYTPLAALIVGRDVFLVVGAFVLRLRSLDWKWPGWQEFFRTTSQDVQKGSNVGEKHFPDSKGSVVRGEGEETSSSSEKGGIASQPAAFVQPLYISKVNTVAQIMLIGGCITSTSLGWPPYEAVLGLGGLTGILTLASGFAYLRKHKA